MQDSQERLRTFQDAVRNLTHHSSDAAGLAAYQQQEQQWRITANSIIRNARQVRSTAANIMYVGHDGQPIQYMNMAPTYYGNYEENYEDFPGND